MKNKYLPLIVLLLIAVTGCEDDTFISPRMIDGTPKNLKYSGIENAREFSKIESGAPTINTDGLVPSYEIVSLTDGEGNELGNDYLKDVKIINVTESRDTIVDLGDLGQGSGEFTSSVPNMKKAGNIVIQDGNKFGPGEYLFTVKVSAGENESKQSTVFDDAFKLTVGPQLVKDLLYSPIAQNLVVGEKESSSKPYLLSGNSDVTFSLKDAKDKLTIDSSTGVISLKDGYSTTENDTIFPTVQVTSNISEETTSFQGQGFLFLVASNEPVELPRKTINFFYPTLEAENQLYGYKVDVIRLGQVAPFRIWKQKPSVPTAVIGERPDGVTGVKAIEINTVAVPTSDASLGKSSLPFESDVIINSQDLSKYATGFDISVTFYTKNQYVEYFDDGTTPSNIEVYISTDYDGDNEAATWTMVNDQIESRINNKGDAFEGTPYPGDQKGDDLGGEKDSSHNADGKWVREKLDLNPYKDETNFTLKFKLNTYFKEPIPYDGGVRSGKWDISDVHFKATEEE